MRRRALAILAVISLVGLGVLLCGYIAYASVELDHESDTPRGIVRQALGGRLLQGGISVGYVRFAPRQPLGAEHATRWRVRKGAGFARPNLRRSLWYFRFGPFAVPGLQTFEIAFPSWCLILPCTIAPLLWLRRRRRINRRGFAIEPSEPSHLADATAAQE